MTGLARRGKLCRLVIQRPAILIIPEMTRNTAGAQTLKPSHCGALVAKFAVNRRMRTQKWKPVLVVPDGLRRLAPTPDGMALLAIAAHLAPVNVGVAINALHAGVRKHRLQMACPAVHSPVHAAQGVPGLRVIEIGGGPDWFPIGRSVAVVACNRQGAVGVSCVFLLFLRNHAKGRHCEKHHHRNRAAARPGKPRGRLGYFCCRGIAGIMRVMRSGSQNRIVRP